MLEYYLTYRQAAPVFNSELPCCEKFMQENTHRSNISK
ncbi:hypothetical protein GGP91_000201 [Salinibacter ruber]|uniref:Uncharacterized protein n=1 Tax=Salinibacter ruber TaxID=146919 RepID=A0A9X2TVR0_9BACT|nr:hypothetical protein [Salinibacter ruber]MCS3643608.1 hypothetical protein [Salinibacter ruber]MCS3667322.1 hypothetical protein [Salinibacter ruber]MCS3695985.1 hypothetical protein [Salinibacter ruber]MCS3828156.1 hypothetical protein [Salinibacter ruber]